MVTAVHRRRQKRTPSELQTHAARSRRRRTAPESAWPFALIMPYPGAVPVANRPTANVPQMPLRTVHRYRAYRVVNVELVVQATTRRSTTNRPETAPMTMAPEAVDTSQPAVMPTRPAREAFRHMETSGLPYLHPGENHADNRCHRRRNRGGEENRAELLDAAVAGRAVEAVPAEPQDEHAEAAQRTGCDRGTRSRRRSCRSCPW